MSGPVLKACPFCGAKVAPPRQSGGGDEQIGYNFTLTISCSCGANISRQSHFGSTGWCDDTGQALEAVVQAWNRRSVLVPRADAAVLEAAEAWVDCMQPGTVSPVGSLRKAAVALDGAVRARREAVKGVKP